MSSTGPSSIEASDGNSTDNGPCPPRHRRRSQQQTARGHGSAATTAADEPNLGNDTVDLHDPSEVTDRSTTNESSGCDVDDNDNDAAARRTWRYPTTFAALLLLLPRVTAAVRRLTLVEPTVITTVVTTTTSLAEAPSSSAKAAATRSNGPRAPLQGLVDIGLSAFGLPSLDKVRAAVQRYLRRGERDGGGQNSGPMAATVVKSVVVTSETIKTPGEVKRDALPLPLLLGGLSLGAVLVARLVIRPSLRSNGDLVPTARGVVVDTSLLGSATTGAAAAGRGGVIQDAGVAPESGPVGVSSSGLIAARGSDEGASSDFYSPRLESALDYQGVDVGGGGGSMSHHTYYDHGGAHIVDRGIRASPPRQSASGVVIPPLQTSPQSRHAAASGSPQPRLR